MKKRSTPALTAALVPVLAMVLLAGCSPTGTTGKSSPSGGSTAGGGQGSGAASRQWKAMEMGPDAKATAAFLPDAVKRHNDTNAQISKPLDVSGKKALFVGYVAYVYAKNADGTYDTAQIDVIGGSLDQGNDTLTPLTKERVYVSKSMPSLYPAPLQPVTSDGKKAVSLALDFMKKAYPDRPWEAALWGHIFYYDYDGQPFVLSVSHDGTGVMSGGPVIQ